MEEKVLPIRFTDNETGESYELDFNRESVLFAENREFVPTTVADFPASRVPEFWYYAFRKNHRKLARTQTDALLEKVGGMTPSILERLVLLYNQARLANVIQDDEDLEKNSRVTVELL